MVLLKIIHSGGKKRNPGRKGRKRKKTERKRKKREKYEDKQKGKQNPVIAGRTAQEYKGRRTHR